MKKISLRELQMMQLTTMKEIHVFCTTHHINYYIIGGTLLGAIRHNGFIPWDDDIDIAMMRKDYDRFVELFSKEGNKEKYFLQNYSSEKNFQPALSRVCIKDTYMDVPAEHHLNICKNTYIDVFPLDNVPDSLDERELQRKDLLNVDKMFERKLGRVYVPGFLGWKKIMKCIISASMFYIPYSKLQARRVLIMKRFSDSKTECVCSTVSQYGYNRQIMDRRIYGTPTLYRFEDTELYGPEKYDAYLTQLYGKNYMQIPPENKRVKPHDVYLTNE